MPEKTGNALTVMLYMVGTDLERKHLDQSACLMEIMEGITLFERSAGRARDPGVRFVAQTGGCCYDPADSVTGCGEKNGSFKHERIFNSWEQNLISGIGRESEAYERLLSRLSSLKGIAWDRNERWEIRGEALIPLEVQPAGGGRCLMTEKDEKGSVSELVDFIRGSVFQFPAQQYILIICGHGGGPLWGFGEDERNDDEMIIPSDICRTVPFILSETGKKLALTAYASCLMSCPENLLAWAESSRSLLAPETNAGMADWLKKDTVLTMLKEVSDRSKTGPLTDEVFDAEILPVILDRAFSGYVSSSSCGKIFSAFCLDDEKIAAFEKEYLGFAGILSDILIREPVDCFRALMDARLASQKIDEYSTDLASFARSVAAHPYFDDATGLKGQTDLLAASIRDMTLRVSHTPDLDENVSGLLLFFPVTDSTTVNSNWEKYLFSLRESEDKGFKTWPFSGYDSPLPRPETERTGNLCRQFLPLKAGILTLGGLFCAIREAGRLLFLSDAGEGEIADKLAEELSLCSLKELTETEGLKALPEKLTDGRDGSLFDEERLLNPRLVCRYRKGLSRFTRRRGLGYLHAGIEDDVSDCRWFYLTEDDGTSFLIPVYKIESDSKGSYCDPVFSDRAELLTPVLTAGRIWMLHILFPKGDDTGSLTKLSSFSFASEGIGKPVDVNEVIGEGEKIGFLGSVAEGERYEMAFFAEHPKEFVIGYTAFRKGLTIKRGSISGLSFPDHYENAEVFCCIRDSFNGLRDTGKIPILRKAF